MAMDPGGKLVAMALPEPSWGDLGTTGEATVPCERLWGPLGAMGSCWKTDGTSVTPGAVAWLQVLPVAADRACMLRPPGGALLMADLDCRAGAMLLAMGCAGKLGDW